MSEMQKQKKAPAWVNKPLGRLSKHEWERLCDGCGRCCLHKLADSETGDIYYTSLACQLLDTELCQCTEYSCRRQYVPECLTLTVEDIPNLPWLPLTCAYRLRYENKPLPDWHPLISGCEESVHEAGISVRDYALSETRVPEAEWPEYVIEWLK